MTHLASLGTPSARWRNLPQAPGREHRSCRRCDRLAAPMSTPPETSTARRDADPEPGGDDQRPLAQHLANLEDRLKAIERRLAEHTEQAAGGQAPRNLQRRVHGLEEREHHHARALAGLESRLATLLAHATRGAGTADPSLLPAPEGTATPSVTTGGDSAAPATGPSDALAHVRRPSLGRRALAALHYLRYLWRRLKGAEDGPFPDQSLRLQDGGAVHTLPSVGLVVLAEEAPDAAALDAAIDRQTVARMPVWLHVEATQTLRRGHGDTAAPSEPMDGHRLADHLRRSADVDYLVSCQPEAPTHWPGTLIECLRLALAAEDLDVVEILLPTHGRLLAQRRSTWSHHPGIPSAPWKAAAPQAIGKVIRLTPQPMAAILDGVFERRFGPYRYAKAGRALVQHTIVVETSSTAEGSAPHRSTEEAGPLLLSGNLLGGREQLYSDLLLRLGPQRLVLTSGTDPLTLERWHRLQALRRLDGAGGQIYPLASFLEAHRLAGAVAWLARRWACSAVLSLAADAADQEAMATCRRAGLSSLEAPRHRAGFVLCDYSPGDGRRTAELGIGALRRRLGLQRGAQTPDVPVVLWFGDLLRERRPEDFLSLAQRWQGDPEAFFLMVGRGPLEGTVDDLARFLGLRNFRRLPSLPLGFAIALCDILCLTAPYEPLPYGLLAAMTEGRAVLLPEASETAVWVRQQAAAATYDATDPGSAVQALAELLAALPPDPGGKRDDASPQPGVSRRRLAISEHDERWRQRLDSAPPPL